MAQHFPRWILTVSVGSQLAVCRRCSGLLVFDNGLRCVRCDRQVKRIVKAARLAYFGLLPPIGIDGLARIKRSLMAKSPPQHLVGKDGAIGTYLLVPLVATLPQRFPNKEVRVAYMPGFFSIEGVRYSGPSHENHMLDQGFMCLFAPGQWQPELTCRQVLQQRAYPHVVKFLNYSNGKNTAFAKVS